MKTRAIRSVETKKAKLQTIILGIQTGASIRDFAFESYEKQHKNRIRSILTSARKIRMYDGFVLEDISRRLLCLTTF